MRNLLQIIDSRLILAISAGFILRILYGFIFYGSYDITYVTLYSLATNCGIHIYEGTNYPHPPGWYYLFTSGYILESLLHLPLYYLTKSYAIIADCIIIIILYVVSKNHLNKRIGLLYALSPVSIIISSLHGQQDSIILLFVLLASVITLMKKTSHLIYGSISFGISLFFKLWPILLIPSFLIMLHSHKKKAVFLFIIGLITLLIFSPFLSSLNALRVNVLQYESSGDFGMSIFLPFLPLKELVNIYIIPLNKWLILLGSFCIALLGKRRQWNIFQTITVVFLFFYVFSFKIGAQYLVWIIPFGLITSSKFIRIYTVAATVALLSNYYWNQSGAVSIVSLTNIFNLGPAKFPWGIAMSVWWLTSFAWFFYNIFFLKGEKIEFGSADLYQIKKYALYTVPILIVLFIFAGYIFSYLDTLTVQDSQYKILSFTDRSLVNVCNTNQINAILERQNEVRYELTKENSSNFLKGHIPASLFLLIGSVL